MEEMKFAQLLVDAPISANWVMIAVLSIAIYFQKRANDKADKREEKIDEILAKQQEQLNSHAMTLGLHGQRLDSHDEQFEGIAKSTRDIVEEITMKIKLLKDL